MDSLFGGGSSNTQQQSTTTPQDMTPGAFTGLRQPLANALQGFFTGGPVYSGLGSTFGPLTTSFNPSAAAASGIGTFASPLSANENTLLGTIMSGFGTGSTPVTAAAGRYLQNTLGGQFLTPSSNPFLTAAISSATAPLVSAFQDTTIPQLKGQFAANGQVLNGPAQVPNSPTQGGVNPASGQGSSAFDQAAAIAQRGLLQNVAQVSSGMANQNYQNERALQAEAASQAPQLTTADLNNLVTSLQAESLPRLVEQYGLDQGLSEFNNRVNVMLQALGLAAGKAGPFVAEQGQSTGSGSSDYSGGILPALGDLGGGFGMLKLAKVF